MRGRKAHKLLCLAAIVAASFTIASACGGGSAQEITPPAPTATEIPPTPTRGPQDYKGFAFPLKGACLPTNDTLMPNAPREYRNGTHEGIDFYEYDNCATIEAGTPVLAAKAGKVIRADIDFRDLTQPELDQLYARLEGSPPGGDAAVLDRFRGRQIWIDHGAGVITRYCHLQGIATNIQPGDIVKAGDVIGYVGDSGTPESVTNPGVENHLHFEIRVGESYLGQNLPPAEVRRLYEVAFSP